MNREFGKRLRKMREKLGLSRSELARAVGMTPDTLYYCEQKGRVPQGENLLKIAEVLGVSVDYLLGRTNNPHIHLEKKDIISLKQIPVYNGAGAGNATFPDGYNIADWIGIPSNSPGKFGVIVHGNSMQPEISDGDIVIVDPNISWKNGDKVVVIDIIETGAMVKKIFEENGTLILQSLNPDYPPIVIHPHESNRYHIIGKVVGIYRKEL